MQNLKNTVGDLLKLKAPGTQNSSFDNKFTGIINWNTYTMNSL